MSDIEQEEKVSEVKDNEMIEMIEMTETDETNDTSEVDETGEMTETADMPEKTETVETVETNEIIEEENYDSIWKHKTKSLWGKTPEDYAIPRVNNLQLTMPKVDFPRLDLSVIPLAYRVYLFLFTSGLYTGGALSHYNEYRPELQLFILALYLVMGTYSYNFYDKNNIYFKKYIQKKRD